MYESKAIPYYEHAEWPCSKESFHAIREIIFLLRPVWNEFLVIELSGYPHKLSFIQTYIDGAGYYFIEVGMAYGDGLNKVYRRTRVLPDECLSVFEEVCMRGFIPDLSEWKDVTDEVVNHYDWCAVCMPVPMPLRTHKSKNESWRHVIRRRYGCFNNKI